MCFCANEQAEIYGSEKEGELMLLWQQHMKPSKTDEIHRILKVEVQNNGIQLSSDIEDLVVKNVTN